MYCAPKGKISQLYYPELDMFFSLKINKTEELAATQFYNITNNFDKNNFIRNYTLEKLWTEYCERQETYNKEYHANKKKTLGANIQQIRLSFGVTVQEISTNLYLPEEKIVAWENGLQMPSITNINILSKFFIYPFDIYIKNSYYV